MAYPDRRAPQQQTLTTQPRPATQQPARPPATRPQAPAQRDQGRQPTAVAIRDPNALAPLHAVPLQTAIYSDLDLLAQALNQIQEERRAFLLSPVVRLDYIPEFHSISLRVVSVDPRPNQGEVYLPDKKKFEEVALTKVALDKIAGAAGISWDPVQSRRLDDHSDPYYCHFRAVGVYRDIDGSRRTLVGEKEIDLRDGNPGIFDPTNTQNAGFKQGWSQRRLDGAREHILAICESKARNRAIRTLGVKQKYDPRELQQKSFVVVALVLTGRSENPALEAEAKVRLLDAAIASSRQLYGPEAGAPTERDITPREAIEEHHAPPPLGQAGPGVDDDPDAAEAPQDGEIVDDCGCPDGPAGVHHQQCPRFDPYAGQE